MTTDSLRQLIPPPRVPLEAPSEGDVASTEALLGIKLPMDYVEMLRTYGTGVFLDFIWPLNLSTKNKHLSLTGRGSEIARLMGQSRWGKGNDPYKFYPAPDGLLPWGVTDNGDILCWETVGIPDLWPTIVVESRGPEWLRYPVPATEFLVGVATGDRPCRIFPEDLLEASLSFHTEDEYDSARDDT